MNSGIFNTTFQTFSSSAPWRLCVGIFQINFLSSLVIPSAPSLRAHDAEAIINSFQPLDCVKVEKLNERTPRRLPMTRFELHGAEKSEKVVVGNTGEIVIDKISVFCYIMCYISQEDFMIRQVMIPSKENASFPIPAEFFGKKVEVLVLPLYYKETNQKSINLDNIFDRYLYSFDNYKFNRDEANNYE